VSRDISHISHISQPQGAAEWPELAPEAYHGPVGRWVLDLAPETEADPAAILVQTMVMVGSVVGRGPHQVVEADRHGCAEMVAIVGATATGRKGTSEGHARRLVGEVDPSWLGRVHSGLTSGEGLAWAVRDRVERDGEEIDPGEPDKRLMVVEPELGGVLSATKRDASMLSAGLRLAWDGRPISYMTTGRTGKPPVRATDAHVSLVGHVTADELRRLLTVADIRNGLGNRLLWVAARRQRLLPHGGRADRIDRRPAQRAIREAVEIARTSPRLRRSSDAEREWVTVYAELSAELPGLVGALIARAPAHTMRLSGVYALLDGSTTIEVEHLAAAVAVVRYSIATTRWLWGAASGDPVADTILDALRGRYPDGLTRTELSAELGRHEPSSRIGAALASLRGSGLAVVATEGTGGRPREVWYAPPATLAARENSEKCEESPGVAV
jgi:hypothetical protein